jgi:hypothetical protein
MDRTQELKPACGVPQVANSTHVLNRMVGQLYNTKTDRVELRRLFGFAPSMVQVNMFLYCACNKKLGADNREMVQ